jgi:hypothetical protein
MDQNGRSATAPQHAEARAVSALNHPKILTIYAIDEIDSEHFIATEFIEGETLRARIQMAPINSAEAIDIGIQVASALCAAHSVGIVHRDVKPENIMLDVIVMSRLAEAYARFGGKEEAHATLKRVFELEPNDGLAMYNCSCAFALLGEKKAATLSLRRAFENGFKTVAHWVTSDSAFDSMRGDVEFQELIAELQ